MNIQFLDDATWDSERGGVYFVATVDGHRVRNWVAEEVLSELCEPQGLDADPVEAYLRHRQTINDRAILRIQANDLNDGGGADIKPT